MTDNKMLITLGIEAKKAAFELGRLDTDKKNDALRAVAKALTDNTDRILEANKTDVDAARKSGMKESLIDRLMLDAGRINAMAEGVLKVAELPDPIGEMLSMSKRPNGMTVGKIRVPIGVIGIIYEARPNVTSDAFALCFKAGNAVILKGGSDALNSNRVITEVIREALSGTCFSKNGFLKSSISLIESTDRETVMEFMKMNEYVDLLIPRGSASLIKATVENSTIPVIETGTGNCHIYVDESADLDMAVNIIINAKTQRVGVCNACESIVIHDAVCDAYFPVIAKELIARGVEIRADERAYEAARSAGITVSKAEEEDYSREYLDYIVSVKTVSDIDEAIKHINAVNTKHSESIITKNYDNARKFLNEIDAACVYVNASTRFTDGYEFGFGAEIGISTQKLHARGPMGLKELTSAKYIIYGSGQVRE